MRPPKKKWNLTARAVLAQIRAVEALARVVGSLAPLPLDVQKRMRQARGAAKRLKAHVLEAEECEMD